VWNTELLTGTSATPKTSNPAQHRKIAELFGEPYNILHKCDIDRAIEAGWIAKPRFQITVASKNPRRQCIIRQFLQTIRRNILAKQEQGLWSQKGGKCIAYLPLKEEVRDAFRLVKEEFPADWKVYLAVEEASASAESMDDKFVDDVADGVPRILFACERYREGSDIDGLEMTSILMGNTIAANILIQIIGRALRLDHVGKEGWCSIFRPSDEGTTEEDVMDNILLEIAETLGRNEILGDLKEIRKMVEAFIGSATIREKSFSVEETVARIQALYERRAWAIGGMSYNDLKKRVREEGVIKIADYDARKETFGWPNNPNELSGFKSWYDLVLAKADESRPCLNDFKASTIVPCGILSLEDYQANPQLPPWEHLLQGYLTDYPDPLPSFLSAELFNRRGGRR
jgi:superfamily II DNA or RNA helicase